ncbi:MAG: Lrp/AsnC family transcriptional regulator [Paracoccaceae bacterium]
MLNRREGRHGDPIRGRVRRRSIRVHGQAAYGGYAGFVGPPAASREGPGSMSKVGLDATDIRILAALQKHGPLSKTELSEIVNLSPTPCWTRLNRLKAAGFIRGHVADIALDRIGDFTKVVVTVSLAHHRKSDFDRFEARVRKSSEIVECVATGGGMDYVLKIVTANMAAFQGLMTSLLEADLGIERYMTYIVTREIKSTPPDLAVLTAKTGG